MEDAGPGKHGSRGTILRVTNCSSRVHSRRDGPSRARTDDLRHAMAALSQLSYGPRDQFAQSSGEVEVQCVANTETLIVARRRDPKVKLRTRGNGVKRNEVAAIEIGAVRRKRVDLVGCVEAADHAGSGAVGRVAANHHHVSVERSPFALHANEAVSEGENHVVAPALARGAIHLHSELESRLCDRRLCDGALLICRQFTQHPKGSDLGGRPSPRWPTVTKRSPPRRPPGARRPRDPRGGRTRASRA